MKTVLSGLYGNFNLYPHYCLILRTRTRILLKRFHYTLTLVLCCFITALVFPCVTVNNQLGQLCKGFLALPLWKQNSLCSKEITMFTLKGNFTDNFNLLPAVQLWGLLVLNFSVLKIFLYFLSERVFSSNAIWRSSGRTWTSLWATRWQCQKSLKGCHLEKAEGDLIAIIYSEYTAQTRTTWCKLKIVEVAL